ncbi:hypothetical protein EDB19DRAFT_1978086 [Suillus lakei]|nr:hypothetical protein EDB19DRAFT_1978086 [Suillus lakei]
MNSVSTSNLMGMLAPEHIAVSAQAILLTLNTFERKESAPTWPYSVDFTTVPSWDDYLSSSNALPAAVVSRHGVQELLDRYGTVITAIAWSASQSVFKSWTAFIMSFNFPTLKIEILEAFLKPQEQMAEFFTLKGMFHARSGRNDDTNHSFGQAVQMDMSQAKAWAEWEQYSDRMFKEFPMSHTAKAVSCYLQAAGQGKAAFWYWISLIPQLCLSISQCEVKQARYILLNLAKLFPQALFFPLRTMKEDMPYIKKQAVATTAARAQSAMTANANRGADGDQVMQDATAEVQAEIIKKENSLGDIIESQHSQTHSHIQQAPQSNTETAPATAQNAGATVPPSTQNAPGASDTQPTYVVCQSWEHIDEVVQILETAFPLLVLSMETMNYVMWTNTMEDDGQLQQHTVQNIFKMATNLTGSARREYEEDFIKSKLTHYEYIRKLQQWRDRQENQYLTEFRYGKFDDIEVPGQYTEDKDSNQNFIQIQQFGPKFENCRSYQDTAGADSRALVRWKESHKQNLLFHIPAAISCSPSLRLLQIDSSYITLGDIYDHHCKEAGLSREDPILVSGEKVKSVLLEFRQKSGWAVSTLTTAKQSGILHSPKRHHG